MSARQVKSVCPYCGVGCGIVMAVQDGRVTKVTGDKSHPANAGRLCTKGNSCAQPLTADGRADKAYIRTADGTDHKSVAMDEAIGRAANAVRAIVDAHGPDAFSLYVSGQMSLEAQYLATKLAKGFIRTSHLESNSRLCMASASSGYRLSLGADGPPGSYEDFDQADLFFVTGANMADCHPILFLRMMDRVKQGAKLIVADPRRTATADKADLFLQLKPGTDLALLNGILHLLAAHGRTDPAFIAAHTRGWEAMPEFLADYTPSRVAEITGLTATDIVKAAQWIGDARNWMSCWTMGLNQSTHGSWNTNAVCNLHLATGTICRAGCGPFSLTGQPNAMGGREMGYMGTGLPGQRSASSAADRAFVEDLWGLPPGTLRAEGGEGTVRLFEDMAAGHIKGCWIICTNPVATVPNRQTVIAALQKAELVITQDAYLDTETNIHADIILPGALWAEGEGVMVNSERNLTLAQKATEPPGEALPDWQIIARVACAMGYAQGFTYASAAEVFDELKRAWNPATGYDLRGASHERLRATPLQWPCPPEAAPRNPIRYRTKNLAFPMPDGKAVFLPRPHLPPAEMPDADYPFTLNTGRLQHQWHTLTKTGKVATLNRLNPGPFIELHPDDARQLGIAEGDQVELRSRRGRAVLPASLTPRVRPGDCFAPFHWNDVFGENLSVNAVTNDAADPLSLQPEFKFCAVALRRVESVPARPGEEQIAMFDALPPSARSAAFARLAGVSAAAPPALNADEQAYLRGFMAGLEGAEPEAPVLPPSAPLAPGTRLYLNGLLAALYALKPSTEIAATAGADETVILWASQTGTAEEIAGICAGRLQAAGAKARLLGMDAATLADLSGPSCVLLIASTFGDGDPPDNGAAFWHALQAAPPQALAGLRYSVLALGDSSYGQFCGFGRRLDDRMAALGASRVAARGECEPDYEAAFSAWFTGIAAVLAPTARAPAVARQAPVACRLRLNRLLSGAGAGKEVRHYAFELQGTGLSYEAGDALGVWPENCPALVDELLALTGLGGAEAVQIEGKGEMPLADALRLHYELTRVTRRFLAFVHQHAPETVFAPLLGEEHKAELTDWLYGRQIADVLAATPLRLDAATLLGALQPLQPRLYSISSSPLAHPSEVHLTVSTVRFGARKGLCSAYLADRAAGPVPLFVRKSAYFRPPADPAAAMIMIGPGTGIAPFRAFLQEREARGATGKNWLFFGAQHAASDFYYRDEVEAWRRTGHLARLDLAFSRDQAEKLYVQHRMAAAGAELWRWLEEGAHVYVCGDASRMARDVDATLRAVIATHGGLSAEAAEAYAARLSQEKRYVRDVY